MKEAEKLLEVHMRSALLSLQRRGNVSVSSCCFSLAAKLGISFSLRKFVSLVAAAAESLVITGYLQA